jgi:YD repeat-containing protein
MAYTSTADFGSALGNNPQRAQGVPYKTAAMPFYPVQVGQTGESCDGGGGCQGFGGTMGGAQMACTGELAPASGEVTVSQEVLLKAGRFNLSMAFYYRTGSSTVQQYGRGRSASVDCRVFWPASGGLATITYGDFRKAGYTQGGGAFTAIADTGALSTLAYAAGKFTEYAPDGMRMEYEAVAGAPADTYLLTGVIDRAGWRHTYSYSGGLLSTIEVPGGRKATFTYAAGSPTSLLTGLQDWGGRRWTFAYDADRALTTQTEPGGCTSVYRYTGVDDHRVTLLWTAEDARGFKTTYSYLADGRIASVAAGTGVWTMAYGAGDSYTTATLAAPSGRLTTYTMGATTRLITSIDGPDGIAVTATYATARVKLQAQAPAGVVFSGTYDTAWRVVATSDALGNRTTLQYDAKGNVTTLIDALGTQTTYAYDGDGSTGLMVGRTDPLGRKETFTYNGSGLLTMAQDGRGLRTTYCYDAYGNVVSIMASDGGITTPGLRCPGPHDHLHRPAGPCDLVRLRRGGPRRGGDGPGGQDHHVGLRRLPAGGDGEPAERAHYVHVRPLRQQADRRGPTEPRDHLGLRQHGLPGEHHRRHGEHNHAGVQRRPAACRRHRRPGEQHQLHLRYRRQAGGGAGREGQPHNHRLQRPERRDGSNRLEGLPDHVRLRRSRQAHHDHERPDLRDVHRL